MTVFDDITCSSLEELNPFFLFRESNSQYSVGNTYGVIRELPLLNFQCIRPVSGDLSESRRLLFISRSVPPSTDSSVFSTNPGPQASTSRY